ncbi:beta-lactamase family protein [Rhodobacteraceae bacterium]|nr:beta-lactamase family protein [Paracoccaceae bacterium]
MTTSALNWPAAADCARALLTDWHMDGPGGAIVAFDHEGERFAHAAGGTGLGGGDGFRPDTPTRLASITKHVFCSFVLAQSDVIALEDPLGAHLPDLAPAMAAITVGQALDMTGGVPDTREALTLLGHSVFTRTEVDDLLAFHKAMPAPSYAPGTEVHYSNGGYRLVEEALRRKGIAFAPYVARLAAALDLDFSAQEYWLDPVAGLATGYWAGPQGWQIGMQGMHLSAAGALCGSGRSLARWGRALLAGTGAQSGLLDRLAAPRHLSDGRKTGYGLGLRHQHLGDVALVGHGGAQPGYKSYLLFCPQTRTGVAMVANRDDANGAEMTTQVMAALLGIAQTRAPHCLTPGLYVAADGADWLEITPHSARRLDDEVALFASADGGADSFSPTSRLQLHMQDGDLRGFAGHAPVHFKPAHTGGPAPVHLDGLWRCVPHGGVMEIRNGAVVRGTGPTRRVMPLDPLDGDPLGGGPSGGGRYLFTQPDPPWTRRVCLCEDGPDRLTLSLSRARNLVWQRLHGPSFH